MNLHHFTLCYFKRAFFTILFIVIPFVLSAQSGNKKFNISVRHQSLEAFTKTLERITSSTFVYGEEVKLLHPITLKMKNVTLPEVLSAAFDKEQISYQINGRYIILKKKQIVPETKPNRPKTKRKFTIHGFVNDASSSETLIGANIFSPEQRQGTTTNAYGFYSITLPEGKTDLIFSYIGYASSRHSLELDRDTLINVRMGGDNLLPDIVITSNKQEWGIHSTQMGAIDIPIEQIKGTPSLLGEPDILKTIQLMPGVQAGTQGATGLYVRGGDSDQNLILLDGIPLYKVDHLFGFFSIFTPEAVKKVTLFKGSFPARFGGRLSSVVDIHTNDGDMQHFHGGASIGTITGKLHLEGPINKGKTSFMLTARRTYLDVPAKLFMTGEDKAGYYFYDINAKVNHQFSDRDRLFLNFYRGTDKLNIHSFWSSIYESNTNTEKYGSNISWGTNLLWLRWNHVFNNQLFANTTVSYNHYATSVKNFNYSETNQWVGQFTSNYRTKIKDWSIQSDFEYNPSPAHHIKFGANYTYHAFHPEIMTASILEKDNDATRDTTYSNLSNSTIYAHEAAVYLEDDWQIGERMKLDFGIYPSFFKAGSKSYFSLQPRVSTRYQLSNSVALKASYTRMGQYIHLLTSLPISLPTDLWVPVTSKIKPMTADQFSAGAYYDGWKNWELSVEGYYKKMNNVLEYKDGVGYYGSSTGWEDKVEMGKGRSYGIEFLLQKKSGKNTGWLSYTWSKSDRKFAEGGINNGERFPYTFDRRHHISLVYNRQFSAKFDIHASWEFYTGGMATLALKQTELIDGNKAGYVPHRNNYRLPSTHILNLGCNFYKKTDRGLHTWSVSLYNVYNAMNPSFVLRDDDNYFYNETDQTAPKLKKFTLFPFIPSFTYSYSF